MTDALLVAIVLLAFTVEATLGFGATVVTVTLASFLAPIDAILAAFVPLNLALSTWLALRHRHHIAWPFLLTRVLPWMLLGLPLGLLALDALDATLARRLFGASVVALAALELARLRRPTAAPDAPLPPAARAALLAAGGFVHGLFATGGPLAVYVTGRELPDKGRFRATLAVLWLTLNALLVTSYALHGQLTPTSARTTALLAPALLGGLLLGEQLHRRLPPRAFRVGVFAALLAAGLVVLAR